MIFFRYATEQDIDIYFKWANDETVRKNSYTKNPIEYDNHCSWFLNKINDPKHRFYIFFTEDEIPIGQVRISNIDEVVIGISVDHKWRGKSLGSKMISLATNAYLNEFPSHIIVAYIKKSNIASYKTFLNAGFSFEDSITIDGVESYKLIKSQTK